MNPEDNLKKNCFQDIKIEKNWEIESMVLMLCQFQNMLKALN